MKQQYAMNDTVHELLSSFASRPHGSLLIIGKEGSGLSTCLRYIISSIYGDSPKVGELFLFSDYSIDGVRELIHEVVKKRSNPTKPRLFIIDDFHRLGIEAQNSLLKSIEEPPVGTHFVLTTFNEDKVLDTIKSRCSVVKMKRPTKDDLRQVFSSASLEEFERAYLIADGWPGYMRQLLEEPDSKHSQNIASAKKLLGMTQSERIIWAVKLKEVAELSIMVDSLTRIVQATTRSLAEKGNLQAIEVWLNRADKLRRTRDQLDLGLNTKAVALSLSIEL